MKSPFLHLWGMPILLGIFSAIGLVSALVADGLGDLLSWLTLGLLVLLMAWCWLKPAR
ncbi:hypothetical protein [Ferrovibrio sp.]|uniref:hypothetical protein n=1 Tax=Ferrovibrio sp. TaxID=1917215 RepID=UPI0026397F4E|nr:hypothetical protein [Ferrovibrio sp.]